MPWQEVIISHPVVMSSHTQGQDFAGAVIGAFAAVRISQCAARRRSPCRTRIQKAVRISLDIKGAWSEFRCAF